MKRAQRRIGGLAVIIGAATMTGGAIAQLRDVTQNPDIAGVPGHPADNAGIGISFVAQQGTSPNDHGAVDLVGSSRFIIARDPARAVRRGRQLFQRKFQIVQGNGPTSDDGIGSSGADVSRSAGFADSCGDLTAAGICDESGDHRSSARRQTFDDGHIQVSKVTHR